MKGKLSIFRLLLQISKRKNIVLFKSEKSKQAARCKMKSFMSLCFNTAVVKLKFLFKPFIKYKRLSSVLTGVQMAGIILHSTSILQKTTTTVISEMCVLRQECMFSNHAKQEEKHGALCFITFNSYN